MIIIRIFLLVAITIIFSSLSAQEGCNKTIFQLDEGKSLFMQYEDCKLKSLVIDGKVIEPSAYNDYEELIQKYRTQSTEADRILQKAEQNKKTYEEQRHYDQSNDVSRDSNDDLAKAYEDILDREDLLFDPEKYTIFLTSDKLTVNGNKMPSGLKERLQNIAYEITEIAASDNYTIKIKVKKGSRSISVGTEN